MSKEINNPWDYDVLVFLAWSKWWVQQKYKKCEVDDMTLVEISNCNMKSYGI